MKIHLGNRMSPLSVIKSLNFRYLPLNTLKTLCSSLFLPYISYCSLLWHLHNYTSYLEQLYVFQNKAIRIITFSPPHTLEATFF